MKNIGLGHIYTQKPNTRNVGYGIVQGDDFVHTRNIGIGNKNFFESENGNIYLDDVLGFSTSKYQGGNPPIPPQPTIDTYELNQWWSSPAFSVPQTKQGIEADGALSSTLVLTPENPGGNYLYGLSQWSYHSSGATIYLGLCGGLYDIEPWGEKVKLDFAYKSNSLVRPQGALYVTHNDSKTYDNNLEVVAWYDMDFTNRENESYFGFEVPYVEDFRKIAGKDAPFYSFTVKEEIKNKYYLLPIFMPISSTDNYFYHAIDHNNLKMELTLRYINSTPLLQPAVTLEKGNLVILGAKK